MRYLGGENPGYGRRVGGISAKAINGFGRERDQLAGRELGGGLGLGGLHRLGKIHVFRCGRCGGGRRHGPPRARKPGPGAAGARGRTAAAGAGAPGPPDPQHGGRQPAADGVVVQRGRPYGALV